MHITEELVGSSSSELQSAQRPMVGVAAKPPAAVVVLGWSIRACCGAGPEVVVATSGLEASAGRGWKSSRPLRTSRAMGSLRGTWELLQARLLEGSPEFPRSRGKPWKIGDAFPEETTLSNTPQTAFHPPGQRACGQRWQPAASTRRATCRCGPAGSTKR